VVNTMHTKEPHAIELRQLTRNAQGEITDVEWFDPAFGKRVTTTACDYVNDLVAPGYDTVMYRWKEGAPNFEGLDTGPPAVKPGESSPQLEVEILENTPVLSPDAPAAVAPREGATRPNPGAAARNPDTRRLMNEVIDEMYPDGKTPPLHVTDQASLKKIIDNGIWEQPAGGGASFSPPGVGTLRMGDVAIRIKPGHEGFIEWRHHPSGRVPIYWRSGKVGVGESRTYIPVEHLEWLNPRARAWRPFEPKGR
jgi:hypothetical protein